MIWFLPPSPTSSYALLTFSLLLRHTVFLSVSNASPYRKCSNPLYPDTHTLHILCVAVLTFLISSTLGDFLLTILSKAGIPCFPFHLYLNALLLIAICNLICLLISCVLLPADHTHQESNCAQLVPMYPQHLALNRCSVVNEWKTDSCGGWHGRWLWKRLINKICLFWKSVSSFHV